MSTEIATTPCGHLLCEAVGAGESGCMFEVTPDLGSQVGDGPSHEPPAERLAVLRRLLGDLDPAALRAEIARRRLVAAVEEAVGLAKSEGHDLARLRETTRSQRAARLLDRLRDIGKTG